MPESNADKLSAVLRGEARYGIELDSALRSIAKAFPAALCLEWFTSREDSSPSFRREVLDMLQAAGKVERLYHVQLGDAECDEQKSEETEFRTGLRIRFSSSDAAYYQFCVFPPSDLDYVSGWSRKRDGDSQVLLLTLRSKEFLDDFIAACRRNPHVVGFEAITEEEFARAASNSV